MRSKLNTAILLLVLICLVIVNSSPVPEPSPAPSPQFPFTVLPPPGKGHRRPIKNKTVKSKSEFKKLQQNIFIKNVLQTIF